MDIEAIKTAIANKTPGWQELIIDNWDCILKHYPTYASLFSAALASSGFNNPFGAYIAAYGAGTNYTLTTTPAAVDFGTTDPVIVLGAPGTYLIRAQLKLDRVGATVTNQTASFKVRRTNNTATDLSVVPIIDLPASTTLTDTLGLFTVPEFEYTTSNSNDSLTIFAGIDLALGAGTLQAVGIGTFISALRTK